MMAAPLPRAGRRAVSPYARRLARERQVALDLLAGSGPEGRIVAADVLAFRLPEASPPRADLPRGEGLAFSARASLAELVQWIAAAAPLGLEIALEDVAGRAMRAAIGDHADKAGGRVVIEAEGRQVMTGTAPGLSIGAERRLRLRAVAEGRDAAREPAMASVLILPASRVVPVAFPLLPGRAMRLVVSADMVAGVAHVLLCADARTIAPDRAAHALETVVAGLERPLALMA